MIALIAIFTVSCNNDPAHKHEYVTKYDAENHWLECKSCNDKKDVAKHDLYTAEITAEKVIMKCRGCEFTKDESIDKFVVVNSEEDLKSAVTNNTDKTIILNKDLALKDRVIFPDNIATIITIDLNGHAISLANELIKPSTSGSTGLFCVYGTDSKLVINDTGKENGIIDVVTGNTVAEGEHPFIASAILVWPDGDKDNEEIPRASVSLVINGGIIKGIDFAISGNGKCIWKNATSIEINDGKFESINGNAIYNPQYGSLTVKGGEFIGAETAIEIRSGSLNISDGIFTSKATKYLGVENGNGTTIQGAAIAVTQHTTKLPVNVEITGGEFNGIKSIVKENIQNNPESDFANVKVEVKGGKFSTDPSALVAEGYKAVESAGSWIVSASK